MTPRILVIAGSDSGGGAGIQADIKTISALGGHAMTAITAITAQNTLGVQRVMPVPADMVIAQIESCVSDIGVDAVKIGMLGSPETANAVAGWLERADVPAVFDPVMIATSGDALADASTIAAFERLMRRSTVTTPNADELAALAESPIADEIALWHAAEAVMDRTGCCHLLAKGGHLCIRRVGSAGASGVADPVQHVVDSLYERRDDGLYRIAWENARIETRHHHGTGCTLSSAIAVGLGQGMTLTDAVGRGVRFVRASLEAAPGLGQGHGPMGQQFATGFQCRP